MSVTQGDLGSWLGCGCIHTVPMFSAAHDAIMEHQVTLGALFHQQPVSATCINNNPIQVHQFYLELSKEFSYIPVVHQFWLNICACWLPFNDATVRQGEKNQSNRRSRSIQTNRLHCEYYLGHETMVCAVCLSIFLWICEMIRLLHGTFVSWWYLPRIWPSVTDMQHYYHARYPTDDWHLAYMFLLVYFSIEVCLEGVLAQGVLAQGEIPGSGSMHPSCWLPPREKTKSNRGDPAHHLHQARGHLNWRMSLPALLVGNLGCWIV